LPSSAEAPTRFLDALKISDISQLNFTVGGFWQKSER
jgi:hypothetical protein